MLIVKTCIYFRNHFSRKKAFCNSISRRITVFPDFSYPSDIFLDIVDRVAETNICIKFDTANTLSYGDDPFPVLEKVMDRIETVHVADLEKKGEFNPVLLGSGIVPFQMIFNRLKKNGFDN